MEIHSCVHAFMRSCTIRPSHATPIPHRLSNPSCLHALVLTFLLYGVFIGVCIKLMFAACLSSLIELPFTFVCAADFALLTRFQPSYSSIPSTIMQRYAARSILRASIATAPAHARTLATLTRSPVFNTIPASASRLVSPSSSSSSLSFTLTRPFSVQVAKDDSDLRTAIEGAGPKLVVVDWSAGWCGPCKAIAPVVEELSKANAGSVVFIKADIDTLQNASVEAGVQAVPTFHFIKNGELVDEFSGADHNKLKLLVQKHK